MPGKSAVAGASAGAGAGKEKGKKGLKVKVNVKLQKPFDENGYDSDKENRDPNAPPTNDVHNAAGKSKKPKSPRHGIGKRALGLRN